MIERHRDHLELLAQPTDADTEVDPAAGQDVDVGHLLGRVDGVALPDQTDAGPQPKPGGGRGDVRQRSPRLEEAAVTRPRELAALVVRVLALVVVEEHDVLGHPQGLEAAVLQRGSDRPGELGVGVERADRHECSDFHLWYVLQTDRRLQRPSTPLAASSPSPQVPAAPSGLRPCDDAEWLAAIAGHLKDAPPHAIAS
jgi:hypothetical protein